MIKLLSSQEQFKIIQNRIEGVVYYSGNDQYIEILEKAFSYYKDNCDNIELKPDDFEISWLIALGAVSGK